MKSQSQWVKYFLIIFVTTLSIFFSFNYIVDPFGKRNWIVEKRFKPIVHERNEKYNTIFDQNNIDNFDCLILGSSRVMTITPHTNTKINQCYNFGVHVANNAEKLFILESWLKKKSLKKLYLGLELYNFHEGKRPVHLNENSFLNGSAGNYFSVNTLKMSYKALLYKLKNEAQTFFNQDGSIYYSKEEEKIQRGTFNQTHQKLSKEAKSLINDHYVQTPFIYDKKSLEPLKKIRSLCQKNNIKLYTFLTPMYKQLRLELKNHPSIWNASKTIHKDLYQIFPNLYDFTQASPANSDPNNFYDPWHYRKKLADHLIDQMQ